jgi:hypothetical protein
MPPSQLKTCTLQDNSILEHIARRDLHWLLLPVEHVAHLLSVRLGAGAAKHGHLVALGDACTRAHFLVCLAVAADGVKARTEKKNATAS